MAAAEAELRAGEIAHPGSERYFVHLHLQAGLSGPELMTHLGVPLPDGQRRLILCDARLRATLHEGTTPVAQGRATRVIKPAVSPVDLATAETVRWNRREQQIEQQATGRTTPHPADPTRAGPLT